MPRAQTLRSLVVLAFAAAATVGWATPEAATPGATRSSPHVLKSKSQHALDAKTHPDKPPVVTDTPGRADYYGGRVISNVNVVPVFWTSDVDATTQSQIGGFLTAIVASPYLDWLEEYDTIGLTGQVDMLPGSNQHIGRGTAVAPITITPMNTATTLADSDIETELIMQLGAGSLPAPTTDGKGNVNSLYMIEFPDAYSINLEGHLSCSYFCGYHYTIDYGGLSVPYAVMPGIGGCSGNCGTGFGLVTSIHSHELMEAITDTEVGFTQTQPTEERPLAWYDPGDNMELADICDPFGHPAGVNAGTDTIAGYTVQLIWSDFADSCVAQIPICDGLSTEPSCRPCTEYDNGIGCTGTTPVCQTSTTAPNAGQCVGCIVDSSCAVPTPICDTTSDTCRACTAADCTGATPLCGTNGACVQCEATNTSACTGKTAICDTTTGTCVGCQSNIDCSGGAPVCNPKTNTCEPCQASTDCSNGQVCDTSSDGEKGQCVDCNTNADCTFGTCQPTHMCSSPPGSADAGRDSGGGGAKNPDGPPPSGSSGGCGCRVAPREDGTGAPSGLGMMVALGLALARCRRRPG
jgi:hypothetical protein